MLMLTLFFFFFSLPATGGRLHHLLLYTRVQVKVSKDDTIVLDGAGARDGIEERCQLLRDNITSVKSDYEKEKLTERLAKLHSGVAVIKVCVCVCAEEWEWP